MNIEVIAQLKSDLKDYQIEQAEIQLQGNMGQPELSSLVQQLIEAEGRECKADFDFIVGNQILRTTLGEHLQQLQIPTEKTLIIQYIFAQTEPQQKSTQKVSDWILSIMQLNECLALGLGDGNVQLCNENGKKIKTLQLKEGIVKAYQGQEDTLLVAYWDKSVVNYVLENNECTEQASVIVPAMVEAMAFNPKNKANFCLGNQNGLLQFFQLQDNQFQPQLDVKLHEQGISVIQWAKPSLVVTGSMDHSIIIYNLKDNAVAKQFFAKDSIITDLHYFKKSQQIVTAHEDGYLKLWETQSENPHPIKVFKSCQSYLSCLSVSDHNQIITGSFDGNLYYWDLRADQPLYMLKADQKILACRWYKGKIAFGGSGQKLHLYEQKQ